KIVDVFRNEAQDRRIVRRSLALVTSDDNGRVQRSNAIEGFVQRRSVGRRPQMRTENDVASHHGIECRNMHEGIAGTIEAYLLTSNRHFMSFEHKHRFAERLGQNGLFGWQVIAIGWIPEITAGWP